jgi:hypothetical protein
MRSSTTSTSWTVAWPLLCHSLTCSRFYSPWRCSIIVQHANLLGD